MNFKELFNDVSSFFRLTSEEAYMREYQQSPYDGTMTRCEHVVLQASRNIKGVNSWTVSLKSKVQGIGFEGIKYDRERDQYQPLSGSYTREDVERLLMLWDENPNNAYQRILNFIDSEKPTSPSLDQGVFFPSR